MMLSFLKGAPLLSMSIMEYKSKINIPQIYIKIYGTLKKYLFFLSFKMNENLSALSGFYAFFIERICFDKQNL